MSDQEVEVASSWRRMWATAGNCPGFCICPALFDLQVDGRWQG